tara:strand:+ start:535 stop:834 length:300 start_codon:yes stop_codon:yes gene_type:complete
MPTYYIRNTETDEVSEEFCSYDELQEWLKDNPTYKQAPTTINIVGGVGDRTKTDGGMKEVLGKIAHSHPNSPLADRFGSGESHGKLKARSILKKRGLIK